MIKSGPNPELAKSLRAAREQAGLSQIFLAVRGGIALGTVHLAERAGLISSRTLAAYSRALGVEVDVLLGHKPPAAPNGVPR